jgi:DNA-binding LacI/PurR family transcriptional regulator
MAQKPMQSIYELADTLGVSTSTISRVLNRRGGIGEATRKRVLASARAAGFRPRMTARQLTIAVVIDRHRFTTYGGFVPNLLSCVVESLSKHDVAVELITEHSLDRLNKRLLDGVLAMAWDDATIETLRKLKDVSVVTLNRMDVPEFSAVASDHKRQGEMAVEYLAGRGHKRLAMICEERNNWGTEQRIDGFLGSLKARELPIDEHTISFTDHQAMYGLLHRLTATGKPSAIFVANESLGLEAAYILQHVLKVSVPHDVSILGMESPQVSQFISPPMTTICQPLNELAERSLEVLLEQLANGGESRRVMLENRLMERESVATVSS